MSSQHTHRVTLRFGGLGSMDMTLTAEGAAEIERNFREKCDIDPGGRRGFLGVESPSGEVTTVPWSAIEAMTTKQFR